MTIVQPERYSYSKYTLEQLFHNDYWKNIFAETMFNFFPFEKKDIARIGYRRLHLNSNIEWDIEAICKFTRAYDKTNCFYILENKKIIWDDYLLDEAGLLKVDWIYLHLSRLSNVKWNNSFITRHQDYFNWEELTLNPNIIWTESLLFEVEHKVKWELLIGNPNVRWSKKIIDRVIRALDEHHVYAPKYNFYEKYVTLALSKGFRTFSTINLLENAILYLKQFNINHSTSEYYQTIWNALSENPTIPWTVDDFEKTEIDICKAATFGKRLPLKHNNFKHIKEINKYANLLAIDLDNDSFWCPSNIKEFIDYFEIEQGKKEYSLDGISYNESIKWNHELFLFVRDNHNSYCDDFKELTKKENFYDFLVSSYGNDELFNYFYKIYDSIKENF